MAEKNTPAPAATPAAMATKYKLKTLNGGAVSVKHPILGDITTEKLQGPRADKFIKAIKGADERKETSNFFGTFIEEVK